MHMLSIPLRVLADIPTIGSGEFALLDARQRGAYIQNSKSQLLPTLSNPCAASLLTDLLAKAACGH